MNAQFVLETFETAKKAINDHCLAEMTRLRGVAGADTPVLVRIGTRTPMVCPGGN